MGDRMTARKCAAIACLLASLTGCAADGSPDWGKIGLGVAAGAALVLVGAAGAALGSDDYGTHTHTHCYSTGYSTDCMSTTY